MRMEMDANDKEAWKLFYHPYTSGGGEGKGVGFAPLFLTVPEFTDNVTPTSATVFAAA